MKAKEGLVPTQNLFFFSDRTLNSKSAFFQNASETQLGERLRKIHWGSTRPALKHEAGRDYMHYSALRICFWFEMSVYIACSSAGIRDMLRWKNDLKEIIANKLYTMVPCVADWSIHIQVHVMHNSLRSFIPTIKSYKSLRLRPTLCDVISASVQSWKVQQNIFLFIRKLKPGIFCSWLSTEGY